MENRLNAFMLTYNAFLSKYQKRIEEYKSTQTNYIWGKTIAKSTEIKVLEEVDDKSVNLIITDWTCNYIVGKPSGWDGNKSIPERFYAIMTLEFKAD